MLLYQSWSICLRNVPCPAPLLKTWPPSSWRLLCKLGTPPSENICLHRRQDRHGPHVSAGSHSSEREPFPVSSHADPHIYNPHPHCHWDLLKPWAEAWTSPSPLPHPHVVLCQCGHFTAERTAPVLLSPHHSLSRGREGWRGRRFKRGEAWRERGRRHLCCSHKAATVGTLTEASVIPCLHTLTCCPRARLFLSSSFTPSLFLSSLLPLWAVSLIVWSSWMPPLEIP